MLEQTLNVKLGRTFVIPCGKSVYFVKVCGPPVMSLPSNFFFVAASVRSAGNVRLKRATRTEFASTGSAAVNHDKTF